MIKLCEHEPCSTPFEAKRAWSRFCSEYCRGKEAYLRRTGGALKVCPICGHEFVRNSRQKKFCTDVCRYKGKLKYNAAWSKRCRSKRNTHGN